MYKVVISIIIGVVSASVNTINAGCCCKGDGGNKSIKRLTPLVDVEISFNGTDMNVIDDGAKQDFDKECGGIKGIFNIGVNDISSNVHVFSWSENRDNYVLVGTEDFLAKQNKKVKSGGVQKLGNTGLYVFPVSRDSNGHFIMNKNCFQVDVAGNNNVKKFAIKLTNTPVPVVLD